MRDFNKWSAADTRRRMNGKKPSKHRKHNAKPASDTIFYLLGGVFVVSVGLTVFLWPASSVSNDQPVALVSAAESIPDDTFSCKVRSITDGDTLRCVDGTRIRLHAVAAREKDESCSVGHPCPEASGAAATAKLSELASGQTLQCEQIGTSYNRVTAVCWNEQKIEINCAMIRSGTTVIWPKFNQQRPICR